MKQCFLILSILLPLCSPYIYAKSIIKGEAKPHRTTRLVILIIAILTTTSLFAQRDQVAIWLSVVSTFQAIVIFILSFKYGMGGWAKIDLMCLFLAGMGIVAWQTTGDPTLALYFGIGADFIGVVPTIVKTYRLPETENWAFFAIDAVAGVFNLLAVKDWAFSAFSYPLYLFLINAVVAILAVRRTSSNPTKLF